ncbi:MAG TPA: MerR family transcriptional regulator, partial [Flavisolibacter sp.]|nr:MerR family transcriptional regulator [Flavisolibacter sp.]
MSFTIRELESLSGIKAHTIRIWEQRYNFLRPSRTQTNIRTYNNDELKTLLTVALLNKYGYKISKIDEMPPEQRAKAVLQLPQEEAYKENLVNEMVGHMIDLQSIEFEELLNAHITQFGIEKTITGVIFQFLEKVGILWQTNRIIPVQEHIVSNIIRQKIVTAIENLPFVRVPEPLFLLFLPEDEHHEMGLLFVYYLLRRKNIPVIYLGANVPLKDVRFLMEIKKPACLYLHLTSFPHQHNFQKYLQTLSQQA